MTSCVASQNCSAEVKSVSALCQDTYFPVSRSFTLLVMSTFGRVWLLIGMLLAASTASVAAAGTPPWQVVARSHKWPTANGMPQIFVRMPVSAAAGRREPEALAVRLLVRRQGRYVPGWLRYHITCGEWRHFRLIHVKRTPAVLEIPFRTWRARSCTIGASAYSSSGGDDIRLQLLCRARSRRSCAPLG